MELPRFRCCSVCINSNSVARRKSLTTIAVDTGVVWSDEAPLAETLASGRAAEGCVVRVVDAEEEEEAEVDTVVVAARCGSEVSPDSPEGLDGLGGGGED